MTIIVQVYIKTKDYADALEFLQRTLYLEPDNIKVQIHFLFVIFLSVACVTHFGIM